MNSRRLRPNGQRGMVLILIAFIIGLGAAAFMYKMFNASSLQVEQDEKIMRVLVEAKAALIAWSVTHTSTPGQMPWPDRREVTPPANYDGQSDCSSVSFALLNSINEPNFLGQMPLVASTTPCRIYNGVSLQLKDSGNNNLWYAVSRNLVRKYEPPAKDPIINPGVIIVDSAKPQPYDGTAATSAYPWLIVRDKSGVIISNRVAVVIIAPGAPLDGQSRSAAAPPSSAYLDNFIVGGVEYSNRDYDQDDEDFVIGDTTTPSFNDRLIFITIDELIYALEKRVGEVARASLKSYHNVNGHYPYAAVLGGVGSVRKYHCINNNLTGGVPIDESTSCTYAASASGVATSCGFDEISSVVFRKTATGNFNQANLSCTRSGRTCTCTGAGSCSRTSTGDMFSCDATGNCSSNAAGRIQFIGAGFTSSSSSICSLGTLSTCQTRMVTCNNSSPTVTLGYSCSEVIATLPTWFSANRWQDTLYYKLTRPTNLADIKVGTKESGAMVATTGPIVSGQSRPSCTISDYLDSTENTNGDTVFEATNKQKTINYNDQTFVVAP